ncbi:hypothetical protein CYMTET_21785 [Cymbomonas tetramitiformis]|uniref:Exostosin GT47 domain-containing protein n=1 Tax=Cymbomonas tetramitiformis TaxID=36881 RepID=A0AAE0G1G7_9CHLO|nr:hypothetical protein CYMTET_21785 [Cymbomonas tetramitiformis]
MRGKSVILGFQESWLRSFVFIFLLGNAVRIASAVKIFIYPDIPTHLTQGCHWDTCHIFQRRLLESPFLTDNPDEADYFYIPHPAPFKSESALLELLEYVKTHWPYWNRHVEAGLARHLISFPCEHGPGDCAFDRPIGLGRLPPDLNPASPSRTLIHLTLNSIRDGADMGQDSCAFSCFQKGKDIQLSTPQKHLCGPLCGFTQEHLEKNSVWSAPGRKLEFERRKMRPNFFGRSNLFFFAGAIDVNKAKPEFSSGDPTGRAVVWDLYRNRTGYRIHNTVTASSRRFKINMGSQMADSVFCFSPSGMSLGDPDRYLPAILMGCIPVMLTTLHERGKTPMPAVDSRNLKSLSRTPKDPHCHGL